MDTAEPRLLRIAGVAELVGLTARAIRYYEELGLLKPAARSEGAYRLYDADDVERLRTIRRLRDDAGFSLAEVGQLLEDEAARARDRARFRASHDHDEQLALTRGAIERADRQLALLEEKAARLAEMVEDARARQARLRARLADLEAGAPDVPGEAERTAAR
jgi:DNA-binding transcriptional MerR regulator